MTGRRALAVALLAVPLACAPLAVAVTVLGAPFWAWFEAAFGVQAYGHHGPLEWCYLLAFALLVAAGWCLVAAAWRRRAP